MYSLCSHLFLSNRRRRPVEVVLQVGHSCVALGPPAPSLKARKQRSCAWPVLKRVESIGQKHTKTIKSFYRSKTYRLVCNNFYRSKKEFRTLMDIFRRFGGCYSIWTHCWKLFSNKFANNFGAVERLQESCSNLRRGLQRGPIGGRQRDFCDVCKLHVSKHVTYAPYFLDYQKRPFCHSSSFGHFTRMWLWFFRWKVGFLVRTSQPRVPRSASSHRRQVSWQLILDGWWFKPCHLW